jgi:hypothetical protein
MLAKVQCGAFGHKSKYTPFLDDAGRGTLGAADIILQEMSDEQLQEELKGFDGWVAFDPQTILVGTTPMNTNRIALNEEFFALLDEWGPLYPIEPLLNADEHDLSTQMAVEDIQVGEGFELDGVKGTSGTIRQYQVLQVFMRTKGSACDSGYEMEGVPYRITIGDRENTEHTVLSMPKGTMVRPLHVDGRHGPNRHGSPFREPEDFVRLASDQNEYSLVSDAMSDAIEAACKAAYPDYAISDLPINVWYSAYGSLDSGTPINNLDEDATDVQSVALTGDFILVAASDYTDTDVYRDEELYADYESDLIEGPISWLRVAVLADRMIKTAGDYHHTFLEGLYLDKKATEKRNDGVKVYRFSMGS